MNGRKTSPREHFFREHARWSQTERQLGNSFNHSRPGRTERRAGKEKGKSLGAVHDRSQTFIPLAKGVRHTPEETVKAKERQTEGKMDGGRRVKWQDNSRRRGLR